MLYVNHKLITFEQEPDGKFKNPYAEIYHDGLKKIKEELGDWPLRLEFPESALTPNKEDPARPFRPAMHTVPYSVTIPGENGLEQWTYAERQTSSDREKFIYEPKNFPFDGLYVFSEQHKEQAFFLICISPHCENGLSPLKGTKRIFYRVVNEQRKAQENVAFELSIYNVKEAVLKKLKTDALRKLARMYLIPAIELLSDDQVRMAIHARIFDPKKTNRNDIENALKQAKEKIDFVSRGMSGNESPVEIFVSKAIDLGIIKIKVENRVRKWCFMSEDKKDYVSILTPVPAAKNVNEHLVKYLMTSPEDLKKIQERIELENTASN